MCEFVLTVSSSCLRLKNAVRVIGLLLLSKETPAGLLSPRIKFQDKAVATQWILAFRRIQ